MKRKTIDIKFANQLYTEPENYIDSFGLVYATDNILSIERYKENENFVYQKSGRTITSKSTIERINNLVIPPAWNNVKIAHLTNAHIQAIGRDSKKRKQYRYHTNWSKLRNQTKFFKMSAFGHQLPKLRNQVEKDLSDTYWSKKKVLALVVKLLEETHIRIGNSYYAKNNNTYGLSTLRSKHVDLYKNKLKFEFVGKRGKKHSVTLRNKKLVKLVEQCEELPGWELFKFFDDNGNKQTVDSGMVNEYIHSISGDLFTAKDFRTWGASKICFETLQSIGVEDDESVAQKNVITAIDTASKSLGNTRNVLRKYYVHPSITENYLNNSIEPYFSKPQNKVLKGLTPTETAMLDLIKTYKPRL